MNILFTVTAYFWHGIELATTLLLLQFHSNKMSTMHLLRILQQVLKSFPVRVQKIK